MTRFSDTSTKLYLCPRGCGGGHIARRVVSFVVRGRLPIGTRSNRASTEAIPD